MKVNTMTKIIIIFPVHSLNLTVARKGWTKQRIDDIISARQKGKKQKKICKWRKSMYKKSERAHKAGEDNYDLLFR